MDDRQREILVGKGLQESRLNEEFIAWLEKYGTRILYVVLIIVVAFAGWSRWSAWQEEKTDNAFAEYDAARGQRMSNGMLTGSPTNLLAVADQYDGRASIWALATLDAADIYVGAARQGIKPGGTLDNESDVLSAEETAELQQQAADLYRSVLARLGENPAKAMMAQRARWGLATALIGLGQIKEAEGIMKEYGKVAQAQDFGIQIAAASNRLEEMVELGNVPPLYPQSELPESAIAPEPDPAVQPNIPGLETQVFGPLRDAQRATGSSDTPEEERPASDDASTPETDGPDADADAAEAAGDPSPPSEGEDGGTPE